MISWLSRWWPAQCHWRWSSQRACAPSRLQQRCNRPGQAIIYFIHLFGKQDSDHIYFSIVQDCYRMATLHWWGWWWWWVNTWFQIWQSWIQTFFPETSKPSVLKAVMSITWSITKYVIYIIYIIKYICICFGRDLCFLVLALLHTIMLVKLASEVGLMNGLVGGFKRIFTKSTLSIWVLPKTAKYRPIAQ